jgi:F0F1-type ATP synthase membrane subunit b/b'
MVEKAKSPRYVIPGFIFTIIITIVFLCLLIFVLYPKIIEINEEKLEVKNKIENLQTLKKK